MPTQPNASQPLVNLDEFKAWYYLMNAKPDTELRLLGKGKVLELGDIRSINERVVDKLQNHDIIANSTSINFILSNGKIKDYYNWSEFERENWDTINEVVHSLSITWDVFLKLPQYQNPQRHSLKLRIGIAIPPKDILQLMLTSDNMLEIIEAQANGVCKVDFVNDIIATELLNIVSNWHDGLKDAPEYKPVQKFLRNSGRDLSRIIYYSIPILMLILINAYSHYLYPVIGINDTLSISNLQTISILFVAVFMIGLFLGKSIERSIDRSIADFEDYPKFLITRGDKNYINIIEQLNKSLTQDIIIRITWLFIVFLFNFLCNFLISSFF
ncbi:MAG: hypothetical protein F6K34_12010 [Okeania sp. SIO4D6]|nr:hypothetical protein [Okeania sp. SIO4D6]